MNHIVRTALLRLLVRMRLASEITYAHLSLQDAQYKKEAGPWFYKYKYSWYFPYCKSMLAPRSSGLFPHHGDGP